MIGRPHWRYRVLLTVMAPLLFGHLLWRSCRDGGWRYFRERLGGGSGSKASLWFHCASVGEIQTALPLIRALRDRESAAVLVTTNTPTGRAVLEAHALDNVECRFMPLDFGWCVRRRLSRLTARRLVVMETEIWPWLFACCHASEIEVTVVNARLSSRSRPFATRLLKPIVRRALADVTLLARSDVDAEAFRTIAPEPERIKTIGNLKFAAVIANPPATRNRALLDREYCLAASTHADEEQRLVDAWANTDCEILLVLVPRHPERGTELQSSLGAIRGIGPVACRSLQQAPEPTARVYLADTVGELQDWYGSARGIFVGGSLVTRGGQNMLEAVVSGNPVSTGPNTENFHDAMLWLESAGAIEIVDDAIAAADFLHDACRASARTSALSANAATLDWRIGQETLDAYLRHL